MINRIKQFVISRIPLKDYIIFESAPDYSDNSKSVYDEMIARNVHHKYKMIWIIKGAKPTISEDKNTFFINVKKEKWRYWYYYHVSKCLISCNEYLVSVSDKQFSMYLCHGNPIKDIRNYYNFPSGFNFILASSKKMSELRHLLYGVDNKMLIPLGYPRNDELTNTKINLCSLFSVSFSKIIVWYPTFRQHKKNDLLTECSHALPIIWDAKRANQLNETAKQHKVLIVCKPHPAQDISVIKDQKLSNLIFINDEFFSEHNITSYQFVGSCDALLTDYSSIYYDYTLCDKPIAVVWEDIEEYRKNPGFVMDIDYMMQGGVKIYTLDELSNFITDVANGIDKLALERREIRDLCNISTDGKNAKRVVDFIMDNIDKRGNK